MIDDQLETESPINIITSTLTNELRSILKTNDDSRRLIIIENESPGGGSAPMGREFPLLSIRWDNESITTYIYTNIFKKQVFSTLNISIESMREIIKERAWHEYAHVVTLQDYTREEINNFSQFEFIYTDFLADYHVRTVFQKSPDTLLNIYHATMAPFGKKLRKIKKIAKQEYSPQVKYTQHLLYPLGASTIFYVHDKWNIIEDFLVSQELTSLSCYLKDINSFFQSVTTSKSPYKKKFEAIQKYASDFTNEKSHELLYNLYA